SIQGSAFLPFLVLFFVLPPTRAYLPLVCVLSCAFCFCVSARSAVCGFPSFQASRLAQPLGLLRFCPFALPAAGLLGFSSDQPLEAPALAAYGLRDSALLRFPASERRSSWGFSASALPGLLASRLVGLVGFRASAFPGL